LKSYRSVSLQDSGEKKEGTISASRRSKRKRIEINSRRSGNGRAKKNGMTYLLVMRSVVGGGGKTRWRLSIT